MKAIIIGKGYWGNILKSYVEKEFEVIDILGRDFINHANKLNVSDVVFIATPLNSHYELCNIALNHNCNIFVEKPTTNTLQQSMKLYDIANVKKCVVFTDYIYTFSQSIGYINKILQNSKIISMNAYITQFGKFYENESVLEVIGIHYISVFALICRDLKVTECSFHDYNKNSATLKMIGNHMSNKIEIKLECSLLSHIRKRLLEIQTDKNMITVDMLSSNTIRIKNIIDKKQIETISFDEMNNLSLSLKYFKKSIFDEIYFTKHKNMCIKILHILQQAHKISQYRIT